MQKDVRGGLWTRVKVGSSHWNPTQARAVTDREMTGVPRGLGGSREITQCPRLLQEWFSRRADLCYLGGCVLSLKLFPNYYHPGDFYSPLSSGLKRAASHPRPSIRQFHSSNRREHHRQSCYRHLRCYVSRSHFS